MFGSRLRTVIVTISGLATSAFLGGCESIYQNMQDPGYGVPEAEIVRSLRCEMVTFFAINYQRALYFRDLEHMERRREAIDQFRYLPLDRHRFAGITLDLKNANSASAGPASLDYRVPDIAVPSNSSTSRFNGALGFSTTYGKIQLFVIPQYASPGVAVPNLDPKDEPKQLYEPHVDDEAYFCYKTLTTPATTRADRFADLQSLADGTLPQFENFSRIRVEGRTPLARWLQDMAVAMTQNEFATVPNLENILQGQLNYGFTLEVRPGVDFKYTLVANLISPLAIGGSIGAVNTRNFAIYLNAKKAPLAYGARTGVAELTEKEKKSVPQMP